VVGVVFFVNVAPTHRAPAIVTRQVGLVPVHQYPVQPVKVEPAAGVAESVTLVPLA
jgi:hypothetical protein